MKFSIVIPAHNEEDNIEDCLNKVVRTLGEDYELIIVDDHSSDSTASIVKKFAETHNNTKIVQNLLEPGFANAIKTGFKSVTSQAAVPVMADLCDDLATIKKMLIKMSAGYDVVCGSRYIKEGARNGGSKFKGALSSLAGKTLYYLLGIPTHDIANAFKLYSSNVLEKVNIESSGFEVSMEIPLKAYYLGFKITEVPTVWNERTKGKSNFKIFKLLPSYLKLYFWSIYKRIIKIFNG